MLIKCPECDGLVSDKAATCPHCGAPMAAESKGDVPECAHGTFCWWMGFIFQFLGILIGAIISGGYGAKKAFVGMIWSWGLYIALIAVLIVTGIAFA